MASVPKKHYNYSVRGPDMQIVNARVTHYRSINDSGLVVFDPEITNIVGVTGSGKTSFLKMLTSVSDKAQFGEADLPHNSEILEKFHDGLVRTSQITQLQATFKVESADRSRLPQKYRKIKLITVKRTLAGDITLLADRKAIPKVAIHSEVKSILSSANKLAETLYALEHEDPEDGAIFTQAVDEAISSLNETDFYNRNGVTLALQALRSAVFSVEYDRELIAEIEERFDEIESIRRDIVRKLQNDPLSIMYRAIPKPRYFSNVFDLEDDVDLDKFAADPFSSKTFSCVAQICGLTPMGMDRARNATPAQRDGYLNTKSSVLASRLNRFWRQENYTFILTIDGSNLRLQVKDKTTGTTTSLSERSDGFRWWMAFFLDLSAYLTRKSGRSVILLDNPATELHEKGKGDVLRFIQEAVRSDRIQIIYSTHERALVDPWRTDRIRVADLTPKGTKIKTVKDASSNGMLETVMNSIGSPARYSLFGAPRTVSFEGVSDTYIVSAINEYMSRTNPSVSLDRDVYSINTMSGITKATYVLSMYKNLDLDFVIVVDRGRESKNVAIKIGPEEFKRYFVEIPEVEGKSNVDIEDLVDRVLYYEAFKEAYHGILDHVPTIDEVDPEGEGRRSDNYSRWFKISGKEYSKTLVAQRMFSVALGNNSGSIGSNKTKALEKTSASFANLFAAIKKKFGDVT